MKKERHQRRKQRKAKLEADDKCQEARSARLPPGSTFITCRNDRDELAIDLLSR